MLDENHAIFTPEEIAAFAEGDPAEEEQKKSTGDGQTYLTTAEAQQLLERNKAELNREVDYLRGQLSAVQNQPAPQQQSTQTQAGRLRLQFDEAGNAVIPEDEIVPLIERRAEQKLQEYHQNNIAPFAPTMKEVQRQSSLNQAIEVIKQQAPDLLDGNDPNLVGKLAIDFFNSGFNPHQDEFQRTQYAYEQVRNILKPGGQALPKSTGAQMNQSVSAFNQVGRPMPGADTTNSTYPWGRGQTVRIPQKSINELGGIDAYKQYAQWVQGARMFNEANNMGWKFIDE